MLEWAAVAVLMLGCAAVTAGVIAIVLDPGIAAILVIVGVVLALVGAVFWTVVVKAATRRSRSSSASHS